MKHKELMERLLSEGNELILKKLYSSTTHKAIYAILLTSNSKVLDVDKYKLSDLSTDDKNQVMKEVPSDFRLDGKKIPDILRDHGYSTWGPYYISGIVNYNEKEILVLTEVKLK